MKFVDALILPALALTIVGFLIFVWGRWLKNKAERALELLGDKPERRD